MKRLIASDLHGSAVFCRQLLALYRETGAQQLVLLGDLAYSGSYDPRYEYDPQNVIDQLNAIAPDILWVEGNCDYGVGALRPRFPGSPKYLLQEWEGRTVFLTHGHRYGPQNPPPRGMAEILLSGHTHVPAWGRVEDLFCANPGSVSLPRGRSDHSCLLYEDGIFRWTRRTQSPVDSMRMEAALCGGADFTMVPGVSFGELGEGYVRIAMVQDEPQIEEACRRLKESGML